MNQTLLFIAPEMLPPMQLVWIVVGVFVLGYNAWKKGFQSEFWLSLLFFVAGAAFIKYLLPQVMVEDPDTQQLQGLPIRGYGVFLLLAVVTGVMLAQFRAKRLGMHPDVLLNLCFWIFGCGLFGARLFYVIQYWDDFDSLGDIINMTEGGLVVYGSLIGSLLAILVYSRRHKIPVLLMMDVLAPCLMIGLSIGRIGCLMNGCCWGGVCEVNLPAITFPEGSPPYARQVETGELFGMKASPIDRATSLQPREISSVVAGSVANDREIKPGMLIENFAYSANPNDNLQPEKIIYRIRDQSSFRDIEIQQEQIPLRSIGVHPSQIYSSLNAFFVFLFLWVYFPYRRHDGQVIGLLLIIYPIGRFLLEFIRADEMGQFGTGFTISQIVSLGSILLGFSLLVLGAKVMSRTETLTVDSFNPSEG